MRANQRLRACFLALLVNVLGAVGAGGCHSAMTPDNTAGSRRDINAVLAAHDRQLLAVPGVVGVYVGLLKDGRTPCLKVMLARDDRELRRAIPKRLEGYPVVTEVTGEIRPLDSR